jgi:hypothetical protein
MQPATTFVNYGYNIKIAQKFTRLGIPHIVVSLLAAREPAHNKGYGLCHEILDTHALNR